MKIKYFGENRTCSRNAIITYKSNEINLADHIEKALKKEGYHVIFRSGDDDITEIIYSVEDKDDFDNLKEIYLEAKIHYNK